MVWEMFNTSAGDANFIKKWGGYEERWKAENSMVELVERVSGTAEGNLVTPEIPGEEQEQ